jgi:hypothetical protein
MTSNISKDFLYNLVGYGKGCIGLISLYKTVNFKESDPGINITRPSIEYNYDSDGYDHSFVLDNNIYDYDNNNNGLDINLNNFSNDELQFLVNEPLSNDNDAYYSFRSFCICFKVHKRYSIEQFQHKIQRMSGKSFESDNTNVKIIDTICSMILVADPDELVYIMNDDIAMCKMTLIENCKREYEWFCVDNNWFYIKNS